MAVPSRVVLFHKHHAQSLDAVGVLVVAQERQAVLYLNQHSARQQQGVPLEVDALVLQVPAPDMVIHQVVAQEVVPGRRQVVRVRIVARGERIVIKLHAKHKPNVHGRVVRVLDQLLRAERSVIKIAARYNLDALGNKTINIYSLGLFC